VLRIIQIEEQFFESDPIMKPILFIARFIQRRVRPGSRRAHGVLQTPNDSFIPVRWSIGVAFRPRIRIQSLAVAAASASDL